MASFNIFLYNLVELGKDLGVKDNSEHGDIGPSPSVIGPNSPLPPPNAQDIYVNADK